MQTQESTLYKNLNQRMTDTKQFNSKFSIMDKNYDGKSQGVAMTTKDANKKSFLFPDEERRKDYLLTSHP